MYVLGCLCRTTLLGELYILDSRCLSARFKSCRAFKRLYPSRRPDTRGFLGVTVTLDEIWKPLMNVFITLPYGHVFPVTCALSRCPEANTIRTDYMTNNSLQMSDHQRLHGVNSCPHVCDLVPDPDPALLGVW